MNCPAVLLHGMYHGCVFGELPWLGGGTERVFGALVNRGRSAAEAGHIYNADTDG